MEYRDDYCLQNSQKNAFLYAQVDVVKDWRQELKVKFESIEDPIRKPLNVLIEYNNVAHALSYKTLVVFNNFNSLATSNYEHNQISKYCIQTYIQTYKLLSF